MVTLSTTQQKDLYRAVGLSAPQWSCCWTISLLLEIPGMQWKVRVFT